MKTVAKFEKVSYEQFKKDWMDSFSSYPEEEIQKLYDRIKLPKRATSGSAGYDFFAPIDLTLIPSCVCKIPTGIRCKMSEGWVLSIYPRSGLGFKYQAGLANTVGIVDSDYYYSNNEGHIFIKMVNRGNDTFTVKAGDGFAQGIFTEFGITEDDAANGVRNGGFGSTTGK